MPSMLDLTLAAAVVLMVVSWAGLTAMLWPQLVFVKAFLYLKEGFPMIRTAFLIGARVAIGALALVGAATSGLIVAVATGIMPMEQAVDWLGQAVDGVTLAGASLGGIYTLSITPTILRGAWIALRDWFTSRMAAVARDVFTANMIGTPQAK